MLAAKPISPVGERAVAEVGSAADDEARGLPGGVRVENGDSAQSCIRWHLDIDYTIVPSMVLKGPAVGRVEARNVTLAFWNYFECPEEWECECLRGWRRFRD